MTHGYGGWSLPVQCEKITNCKPSTTGALLLESTSAGLPLEMTQLPGSGPPHIASPHQTFQHAQLEHFAWWGAPPNKTWLRTMINQSWWGMVGISTNKNEFNEDVAMMLKLVMTKIISPSVSKYVNQCGRKWTRCTRKQKYTTLGGLTINQLQLQEFNFLQVQVLKISGGLLVLVQADRHLHYFSCMKDKWRYCTFYWLFPKPCFILHGLTHYWETVVDNFSKICGCICRIPWNYIPKIVISDKWWTHLP